MGHEAGSNRHTDEARLGMLLERTYAARAARATPPEDALTRLNAALDRIDPPSHHRTNHCRTFGACALAVFLLLSSVALSEFVVGVHNATHVVAPSIEGTVGNSGNTVSVATGRTPATGATAQAAGASETPLRDLLDRAGIHALDSPGGFAIELRPLQH